MANDEIELILSENVTVHLTSNTPDMDTFVKKIVENRDKLDPEKITVNVPDGINFDTEGFLNMVKKIVTKYLEVIKLETDNFEKATSNEKCEDK